MKNLKEKYNDVAAEYLKRFERKQKVKGYWVGDVIGGVADFGDTSFFNYADIVWDINSQQPKGRIFEWIWGIGVIP